MSKRLSRLAPLAVIAAALAIGAPVLAQIPADASQRVDEIFARWDSNTSAGCAVGVSVNGLTVMERAYGMADLEHNVPNTPETIFEGGSLSKQFTSAAIVLLAMDGAISLDDDVREYVPELPDYGTTITIKHLMTHTSGLRDWGSVAAISGWGREQRSHDHDWVVDILSRQSALNYVPGHRYSYTNSGYNLLAVIVDRVSGMSFADFSMERVFKPLGLKNTQWRDDHRRIVPGRSSAYNATGDGWEINRPIEDVHGNGGILTTVGDLTAWNQALSDERFGPDFTRMMHDQGELNDGSTIVYAGGLRITEVMGVRSISHTGATSGYRAFTARYPDQGLSVSMLCNASNAPTGGNGRAVARIFLADAVQNPVAPEPTPVAAATLESYAGLYREPTTGNTMNVRASGDVLRAGAAALIPVSATRFQAGASQRFYDFHTDGPGRPWISVDSWEFTDERYEPVDAWQPTEDDLEAVTGTYESWDAETTYVVSVENGTLTAWQRPGTTFALAPIYEDAFRARGSIVRFRRDENGRVSGLSLSSSRVYDMRFTRTDG
jgi:CubicO group peptidase (beta-lactamase class C family)